MKAKAIDFVVYEIADLQKAVAFYRDALGLKLDFLKEEWGWAEFEAGSVALALNRPEQGPPRPGGAAVALAVDDVAASVEELRSRGAPILREPFESGVCYMALVADPDGNPLWLHKRKDGTCG